MGENLSGQHIGSYLLLDQLGGGQFGAVYLARHSHTHSQVAIKILHGLIEKNGKIEERHLEDFLAEARASRLTHPNIVRIRDFDTENKRLYIVMDYLSNGNLRQRHPRGSLVAWENVISYASQIAEGLQCMHDNGIVHRDIKPENILIGPNNEMLVGDFGIAVTSYTWNFHTQVARGSAVYIAPEQIDGKAVRESDQYSLGIMMYEWLCGEPPFVGSRDEVLIQQQMATPASLRERNAALPQQVEDLVMRLLAKKPQQRFENMGELIKRLNSLRTPTPIPPLSLQEVVFRGHNDGVRAVAWSPDGQYVASAGCEGKVLVWDVKNSAVVCTYSSHIDEVWCVAWSPDSKYVVSAGADKTVQVWEAATGNPAYTDMQYAVHSATVRALAWSHDGKHIASAGDDKTVRIWNTSDGSLAYTYRLHTSEVRAVAWAPGRSYIASGGDDATLHVWSMVGDTPPRITADYNKIIMSLAWSPDGEYLASGSDDCMISIWHAATGEKLHSYMAHNAVVSVVAWSPDNKFIASGSWDKTIQVWEINGAEAYFVYRKHEKWINALAWSPDGCYLVSGSSDNTAHIFSPHG